ncbi:hypothetical protein [Paenibacillus sp. FSL P4-0288]|uniref:hypothetical protein n=1 Tax=Paenibacillus sp. FSL P4-0288 TaxID=2921633 RepID=UPI0030FD1AA0
MDKIIIGYDPGGKNANGIAYLKVSQANKITGFNSTTCNTLDEVLYWLFVEEQLNPGNILCAGIDAFLSWPTIGNWRPMDLYLQNKYSSVSSSVLCTNSASGSMAIQGIQAAGVFVDHLPNIHFINETHPKVAYYALTHRKHDYYNDELNRKAKFVNMKNAKRMWLELSTWITADSVSNFPGISTNSLVMGTEHEWDALFSAWFTYHYGILDFRGDLMQLKINNHLNLGLTNEEKKRIIKSSTTFLGEYYKQRIEVRNNLQGKVKYVWPL